VLDCDCTPTPIIIRKNKTRRAHQREKRFVTIGKMETIQSMTPDTLSLTTDKLAYLCKPAFGMANQNTEVIEAFNILSIVKASSKLTENQTQKRSSVCIAVESLAGEFLYHQQIKGNMFETLNM
jgi:hypothetical protein